jgi:hypothetical protein
MGATCLPTQGWGAGFGPKTQNRVFVAWFRGCRVKRRHGVMVQGGGWELVTYRRRGCCAFTNVRPGGGVWAKNLKPSVCGSVSGVPR